MAGCIVSNKGRMQCINVICRIHYSEIICFREITVTNLCSRSAAEPMSPTVTTWLHPEDARVNYTDWIWCHKRDQTVYWNLDFNLLFWNLLFRSEVLINLKNKNLLFVQNHTGFQVVYSKKVIHRTYCHSLIKCMVAN